jgi:hypothetical protein
VLRTVYGFARRPSMYQGRTQTATTVIRDAFAQGWQVTPPSCLECRRNAGPRPGSAPQRSGELAGAGVWQPAGGVVAGDGGGDRGGLVRQVAACGGDGGRGGAEMAPAGAGGRAAPRGHARPGAVWCSCGLLAGTYGSALGR